MSLKINYKTIKYNGLKLHYILKTNNIPNNVPWLLFLHGFSGSSKDWLFFIEEINSFNLIAPDIIGHGASDSPVALNNYTLKEIASQLKAILIKENIKTIIPIGYSMGGRIAIQFAGYYPELIKAMILESASAGIKSATDRAKRIEEDNNLAENILATNLLHFFEQWFNKDIFKWEERLNKKTIKRIISERSKNSKIGLANILKAAGTGKMKYSLNLLKNINVPILFIAGALDEKFKLLVKNMAKNIEKSKVVIVDNCGHNVHLEKPEIFINLVKSFLKNFER